MTMMKTFFILLVCNIISTYSIDTHSCYICDVNGCDHPTDADIKDCTENDNGAQSGSSFVKGALGNTRDNNSYNSVETALEQHVESLQLNTTLITWKSLTRWACYVTKDKHRGCFIMGKGLCAGDKSLLARLTDAAQKITSVMDRAAGAVESMFKDTPNTIATTEQKKNISTWIAQSYMTKLINNSGDAKFQLESCCDADKCNLGSMIQKSTAVLLVLLLSIFILV